jgi:hypothetical protein
VPDPEPVGADSLTSAGGRGFAWAVLFVSFALLLSDFMSPNALVPAFPLMQRERACRTRSWGSPVWWPSS